MTHWLFIPLAILVALAPYLPLRLISNESLARARDFWLLLMLAVGTIWAAIEIPPFAPIGLFFLWHWRGRRELPSLMTWAALGIFFFGVGRLPEAVWLWIPLAWLAAGAGAAGHVTWQWWVLRDPARPWWNPHRPFHGGSWFGQRTVAAGFFALLLPVAPWWALPIPLLGLAVTSSWAAWLAAAGAAFVLRPSLEMGLGAIVLPVAILALGGVATGRWRLLEYTPRGDSLDSLWQRVRVARLLLFSYTNPAWWPFGRGPRSMEGQIIRWASKVGPEAIPLGQPHQEVGHFLFEYGLCGLASLILLAVKIIPRLQWGDMWSAMIVAGVILGGASIPFRVMSTGLLWLTACAVVAAR